MGKHKITKEELKKPDAFLALGEVIMEYADRYKVAIITIIAVALVVSGSWVGYNLYQNHVEMKAQAALYAVESQYEKIMQADMDKKLASAKQLKGKKGKATAQDDMDEKKDPAALKQKFGAILQAYKQKIAQFKGTKAALIAAINVAYLQNDYKDYEGAAQTLRSVAGEVSKGDLFYGFVHDQLGTVLLSAGQGKEALAQFEMVLNDPTQIPVHPDVMLKIGMTYEKMQDFANARKMYLRVSEEHPNTMAANEAKSYLRLLVLNSHNHKLAPATKGKG